MVVNELRARGIGAGIAGSSPHITNGAYIIGTGAAASMRTAGREEDSPVLVEHQVAASRRGWEHRTSHSGSVGPSKAILPERRE